jgi:GT2 family glycosyltransferase
LEVGELVSFRDCYGANFSVPRKAFFDVGGFFEGIRRIEDTELAYRLEMAGVPLVFCSGARALHYDRKTVADTLRDAEASGRAAVVLWRDRPEFLRRRGGGFRRPRGKATATLTDLALRIPVPFFAAAALGRRPRRLPGAKQAHLALWLWFYLEGARQEVTGTQEWQRYLNRPASERLIDAKRREKGLPFPN